jgi:hypothetical protein
MQNPLAELHQPLPDKPRDNPATIYLKAIAGMHPDYKRLTEVVAPYLAEVIAAIDTVHAAAASGNAFAAISVKTPDVAKAIQEFSGASDGAISVERATRVLFGVNN